MSKQSELAAELDGVLTQYKLTHDALCNALDDDSMAGYQPWLQVADDPHQTFTLLKMIIMGWSYDDDTLAPGKTIQHNGLCPCSTKVLNAAADVNISRKILHQQLMKIDKEELGRGLGDDDEINDRIQRRLSKQLMHRLGYPRFNRRQACRQFVVLPHQVLSAGFFWNRYRKTVKLDRLQVIKRLDKMSQSLSADEAIIQDCYRKLDEVDDQWFIQVFKESIHQRVNLYLAHGDKELRIQKYAHTPVFYISTPDMPLPPRTLLPDKPHNKESRLQRRNITTEPTPFMEALSIHRLLPTYREKS